MKPHLVLIGNTSVDFGIYKDNEGGDQSNTVGHSLFFIVAEEFFQGLSIYETKEDRKDHCVPSAKLG